MLERTLGIIRFNTLTYRAVASDPIATRQAAVVVILVSLIQGLGSKLAPAIALQADLNWSQEFLPLLLTVILGLIMWVVTAWLLAFIAKGLGGKTNFAEMLRLAGFVQIFGLLSPLVVFAPTNTLLNTLIAGAILVLGVIGYALGLWETASLPREKALIVALLATLVSLMAIFVIDRVSGAVIPGLLWMIG